MVPRPASPTLPAVDPPGAGDRLVVVSAHPDDESLGAGGLIADRSVGGPRVQVVVATDGEASHREFADPYAGFTANGATRGAGQAVAELGVTRPIRSSSGCPTASCRPDLTNWPENWHRSGRA